MSIKSVGTNSFFPIDLIKPDLRKTRNTTDREPNQNLGGGKEELPKRRDFTEEEIEEAVKFLKGLKGVKENNLQVRVSRENERIVIFVEDISGKIISRIPDTALRSLLKKATDETRGNLLNKSL